MGLVHCGIGAKDTRIYFVSCSQKFVLKHCESELHFFWLSVSWLTISESLVVKHGNTLMIRNGAVSAHLQENCWSHRAQIWWVNSLWAWLTFGNVESITDALFSIHPGKHSFKPSSGMLTRTEVRPSRLMKPRRPSRTLTLLTRSFLTSCVSMTATQTDSFSTTSSSISGRRLAGKYPKNAKGWATGDLGFLGILSLDLVKSRSREIRIYNFAITLKSDRRLGSIAAESPVKFQSDVYTKSYGFETSQDLKAMMTSSNRNIFRFTGHLCGNSPVTGEFTHKGQWRRALMFSLIWAWMNGWGWWFETPSRSLWRHNNVWRLRALWELKWHAIRIIFRCTEKTVYYHNKTSL